jgi:magnesium chelatase subunit D
VLVLDHTTPHRENWTRALSPHLHWAYETRAAITIIEFGHDGIVDELRPERHRRNSVVDPCVEAALDRRPGRASPLAAAIDLAAEELCRLRMRSQPAVRDVRLIVVTDGRGNVPYAASASGRLNGIVRREGVEDALAVARDRRIFHDVRTTVVTPRLHQYAELPDTLAHALHGLVSIFPPPASDNQR